MRTVPDDVMGKRFNQAGYVILPFEGFATTLVQITHHYTWWDLDSTEDSHKRSAGTPSSLVEDAVHLVWYIYCIILTSPAYTGASITFAIVTCTCVSASKSRESRGEVNPVQFDTSQGSERRGETRTQRIKAHLEIAVGNYKLIINAGRNVQEM